MNYKDSIIIFHLVNNTHEKSKTADWYIYSGRAVHIITQNMKLVKIIYNNNLATDFCITNFHIKKTKLTKRPERLRNILIIYICINLNDSL